MMDCIARGASLAFTDGCGDSALHVAACSGAVGMAEVLLRGGALVNARNRFGLTALHMAAMLGRGALCSALLSAGAVVDALLMLKAGRRCTRRPYTAPLTAPRG